MEQIEGVNQNPVQILIDVLVVIAEILSNASSMGPPWFLSPSSISASTIYPISSRSIVVLHCHHHNEFKYERKVQKRPKSWRIYQIQIVDVVPSYCYYKVNFEPILTFEQWI